ncbi:MAG: hypothetical protein AMJ76_02280 [Dehalococcoidia bacterium SM23_28_1]|nr:MAG: hypothetical protein AMJ76_02280 [Dehalococcoidia bacterium SM23_28_1]
MTSQGLVSAVPLLRGALQWLFGILLALSLIALFLVINAVQLTSSDTAQRILSRATADLTEIDALLPTIQADLAEAAEDSEEATVTVPHFPLPVELPREEAATISTAELRSLLLSEAAEAIYKEGMSVWALADPEAEQNIDILSPEGGVHRGLGFLSDDNHQALRIAAIVLGLISLVLAGLVLVSTQGMGRLVALGAAVLGAAVPSLLGAVAVRFAFRTASEDQEDYMLARLLDLGNDAAWLTLRNYTILTLVGLWLVVVGLGLVLLEMRQRAAPAAPTIDNGSAEA